MRTVAASVLFLCLGFCHQTVEAQNPASNAQTDQRANQKSPAQSRVFSPINRMPGRILPLPVIPNTQVGHARQKALELPVPDNSLWFRYFKAGEEAGLKHDSDKAKKYWMASLSELERVSPNPNDDLMSVKLSALEISLIDSFPKNWTNLEGSDAEKQRMRDQQVNTLYRMAVINSRLVPSDRLLCSKSMERYEIAKKENEKACLLYTSPSPRDGLLSRMPSSA